MPWSTHASRSCLHLGYSQAGCACEACDRVLRCLEHARNGRVLEGGWKGATRLEGPLIQCCRDIRPFWSVQAAAQRMVEFWLGTFADPIYLGDWPASVKARIPYIPTITPELVRSAQAY